jgi:hypothetical protein
MDELAKQVCDRLHHHRNYLTTTDLGRERKQISDTPSSVILFVLYNL